MKIASRSIVSTVCPNDRNTLIVQSIRVRPGENVTRMSRPGRIFFGLSSDLEFFLNKIFFLIIKINRLPSITMEAQAVARDQHLARWKRVSIRFEFLALIMVVILLVGSRVYFR